MSRYFQLLLQNILAMSKTDGISTKTIDFRDVNSNSYEKGKKGYVTMRPSTPILKKNDLNNLHPRQDSVSRGMFSYC